MKGIQVGRERLVDPEHRIETAVEHYWLQGMDLAYSKKRALGEGARAEAQMQADMRLVARQR